MACLRISGSQRLDAIIKSSKLTARPSMMRWQPNCKLSWVPSQAMETMICLQATAGMISVGMCQADK